MEPFKLESSFVKNANEEAERLKRLKAQQKLSGSDTAGTANKAQAVNTAIQATGAGGAEDTSTGGNVVSGAGQGALLGAQLGGPTGALVGAGVGAVGGIVTAKSKREKAEREADAQALRNNSLIEQNAGQARANAISSLAQSISQSLLR